MPLLAFGNSETRRSAVGIPNPTKRADISAICCTTLPVQKSEATVRCLGFFVSGLGGIYWGLNFSYDVFFLTSAGSADRCGDTRALDPEQAGDVTGVFDSSAVKREETAGQPSLLTLTGGLVRTPSLCSRMLPQTGLKRPGHTLQHAEQAINMTRIAGVSSAPRVLHVSTFGSRCCSFDMLIWRPAAEASYATSRHILSWSV